MFDISTVDQNTLWLIIGIVAAAIVIAVAFALTRRAQHRTTVLRGRFGPEYDRAVQQYGRRDAERELAERERRVAQLRFRELSDAERVRYTTTWESIQAQFVDDPRTAVARANELIKEVMRARGYAADTAFEQRAADLSVDHPDVVQHYRAARALAETGRSGGMNTEELRQAVVHYRVLFADLLQPAPMPSGLLHPAHA